MGLLSNWRESRFRRRWMSEEAVIRESAHADQAPDATLDEVGVTRQDVGFTGSPIRSGAGNGYGTGNPNSPGWAGWAGSNGVS